uniref:Uncharacterized protein n=1 Tax=Rhizophagus irregularis (strain DAOM 181602 / DAOM 197198 / MUCL 43194) TaxID=747089 RepID=U9SQZ7_RHIID
MPLRVVNFFYKRRCKSGFHEKLFSSHVILIIYFYFDLRFIPKLSKPGEISETSETWRREFFLIAWRLIEKVDRYQMAYYSNVLVGTLLCTIDRSGYFLIDLSKSISARTRKMVNYGEVRGNSDGGS